jgi:hypothetical protein
VIAVIGLVTVTCAVAGWYFLGRSGDAEASRGFLAAEQRYAGAVWAVKFAPLAMQQYSELDRFNAAVDAQALVMEQSLDAFARIAHAEEGAAATIARRAVNLATEGLRAIADFRDAIVSTSNLADAHAAIAVLNQVVDQLEVNAKEWRQHQ